MDFHVNVFTLREQQADKVTRNYVGICSKCGKIVNLVYKNKHDDETIYMDFDLIPIERDPDGSLLKAGCRCDNIIDFTSENMDLLFLTVEPLLLAFDNRDNKEVLDIIKEKRSEFFKWT